MEGGREGGKERGKEIHVFRFSLVSSSVSLT